MEGDDSTRVPLEKMKNVYYHARGWDDNGVPTPRTLRKLGLDKLEVHSDDKD